MKIRHVVLLVVTLLLLVFVGANWQQFTTPVELDLIVQQYQAPFGLLMLGVLAVFAALFLLSLGGIKTSAQKKKLQALREIEKAQRTLIDAEGHRLSRLEEVVRQQLQVLEAKLDGINRRLADGNEPSNGKNRSQKPAERQQPAVIGSTLS